MAWFWSDDLARSVRRSGVTMDPTLEERLFGWESHPVAFVGETEEDDLTVARRLLGMQLRSLARTAPQAAETVAGAGAA